MRGFSLVELSIVLVILGLLIGGILTGQSLIRASELRSISTDISKYQTAVYTFRDRYFALPGDMPNATSFWGAVNTTGAGGKCSAPIDSVGTGTQTCDGDGNGSIRTQGSGGTYYETHRAWQHLANAGLIEGSYSGTRLGGSTVNVVPGQNAPSSKIGTVSYFIGQLNMISGDTERFDQAEAQILDIGTAMTNSWPSGPFLTPSEQWNIDQKIDDGKPGSGKIRSFKNSSTQGPGCATTDNSASAEYALSDTSKLCMLLTLPGW